MGLCAKGDWAGAREAGRCGPYGGAPGLRRLAEQAEAREQRASRSAGVTQLRAAALKEAR